MKLINIVKSYGNKKVLNGITLDIEERKVTAILGESGSGKSTLLNIIAGKLKDYKGEVIFESKKDKGISYIFQEDTLIPWKTVYGNLEFVLKRKIPVDKIETRIKKYLKMVGLDGIENEYPYTLSGGMKRRVGIARAFSFPSSYLFMDEPFEFLDIKIKNEIIEYFIKLQNIENKTVIFITHDIESAVSLGEKIVVFANNPTEIKKVFENSYPKEKNIKKKEKLKNEIEKLFL